MNPIVFGGFAFGLLTVAALLEVVVVTYLPRWTRHAGFSLASLTGELADRYVEIPTDLAGLEVTRLDDRTHLVEPRDAFSGGTRADANAATLAFAILELDGRRWTMNVRANRGYQLIGIVAPIVGTWVAATQHLSMPQRLGVLLFTALTPYAVLSWRRRVRGRFVAAAQVLTSGHTAEVRVPARSL